MLPTDAGAQVTRKCNPDRLSIVVPEAWCQLATMIVAFLLLGMQQAPPIGALLSSELAVERMAQCGLGRPKVRYDKELQIEVLVLRRSSRASDDQLACLDKASGHLEVELPLPLQWRFNAIRDARLVAYFKAAGRAWLLAHGLIDRLPAYSRGDEAAFAHALEQLCGPGASGAFRAVDGGYSFNPEWSARQEASQFEDEAGTCLSYAMMASGFPLGFIGNEAERP